MKNISRVKVLVFLAFLLSLMATGTSGLTASSDDDNAGDDNSPEGLISQGDDQLKTFTTRDNAATVQHPPNWIPTGPLQELGPIDIIFTSPGYFYNAEESEGAEIEFIQYEAKSIFSTAKDSLDAETTAAQNDPTATMFQIEQPVECSTYILNGLQACSYIAKFDWQDAAPSTNLAVDALADDGTEYEVYYRADADSFQQFLPIAENMIKSFRTTGNDGTLGLSL